MEALLTVRDLLTLLRLRRDPVGALAAVRGVGAVVSLGGWPRKKYYYVSSPEAIRFLLFHDSVEIARHGVLEKIFVGSWFIARGVEWAEKRAYVLPAYNVGGHGEYADRVRAGLEAAFRRWDALADSGTPADVGAEMLALALDVMLRMLFTARFEPPEDVRHLFHDCMEWNRWRLTKWRGASLVPRNVQFRRAHARLRGMVRELMAAERRAGGAGFLALMESARDREGRPLAPVVVESEVLNILSVGHVSSGSALTWTLYEMMRHPAVVERLREESSVVSREKGVKDALTRRTWSAQVVAEAMRLHPPIWLFTRRTLDEVRLEDGSILPKGAALLFSPRVLHRDPAYWRQPDEFDPSRFESMKWPPALADGYFPFGAGKRQCLGKGIATLVAALIIPAIAERYDLEPLSDAPVEALPLTTLMPARPLMARWHRRTVPLARPLEALA